MVEWSNRNATIRPPNRLFRLTCRDALIDRIDRIDRIARRRHLHGYELQPRRTVNRGRRQGRARYLAVVEIEPGALQE